MITKITFWCQKVLPVEFDDSLSYYEQLCKVVDKLNEVINDTNKAFNQLETDVNAELNNKQDTLVSGENIKTVNGESILGSGNIDAGGTDVEGNPTGDATDGDLTKIKIDNKIYSIHNYTDAINNKQDTLVSGENIKTVNRQSILGSGNIDIEAGGTDVEGNPSDSATDGDLSKIKIESKVYSIHNYTDAINAKQDTLVSGTNIKTINNKSILGSGNIDIEAGGTNVEGNPTEGATDGDLVKIKIGSKIYSIHDYSVELDKKVNLIDDLSDGIAVVYAAQRKQYSNGSYWYDYTPIQAPISSTHPRSIVRRGNDGSILAEATTATDTSDFIYKKSVINHEEFDREIGKKQNTLVSGTNIKTVNGQSILGTGNIEAGGTDVEGNPTGSATDGDLNKIKIGSKIYSIHDYTDAINGKLDKVTGTSTHAQIYAKSSDGVQAMVDMATNNINNSVIFRDGKGNASIATPTQSTHIANKHYVDNAISGKQDMLVSGENIKTVNGQSILGSGNISIEGGSGSNPFSDEWIFLGIMTANNAGSANFDIASVPTKTIQVYIRDRNPPHTTYSTIIYCTEESEVAGNNSYNMPYSEDATYNLNVFVTNYANSDGEYTYSTLTVVRTSPFTSHECEIYYRILG